jgi:polysaccharide export outer membrane protein
MKKYLPLLFIFCLIFASNSYAQNDATFRNLQIELGTLQAGYFNHKLLSEIPENEAFRTEVWYPLKLGTFQKHERVEIVKLSHDKWKIHNPDTGEKIEFSVSYTGGKLKITKTEPLTAKEATVAEAPDEKAIKQVKTVSAKQSQKDYIIASGDVLEITTWKEPELSRDEIVVRTDGKITFPLLNDVQAAGLSALELKMVFETGLKDYVANPVVTVVLKRLESQKFYVLGEVINTGEYSLTKDLTVMQAIAMAGGFTEWASRKNIILMRKENGKEKNYRINYNDIIKFKDLSQNLKLKVDDTIIVP